MRLAHIAMVALPVLSLLYLPWMERCGWTLERRRAACGLLLLGTTTLPVLLVAAAFWQPAFLFLGIPVLSLIAAVCLLAAGLTPAGPGPPPAGRARLAGRAGQGSHARSTP